MIGNFDQEFVDKCYSRLKGFSLILMEDIATYCEKPLRSTNEGLKNNETLRSITEKQEFLNINKILKTNAESTKR